MMTKEEYVSGKGLLCPFCGSESIQGGFIQVEAGVALQEMGCARCENRWQDIYRLVGFEAA